MLYGTNHKEVEDRTGFTYRTDQLTLKNGAIQLVHMVEAESHNMFDIWGRSDQSTPITIIDWEFKWQSSFISIFVNGIVGIIYC